MYNILHLAASRGMSDAMRSRRPRPTVQPAGASHATLIGRDPAQAPATPPRRTGDASPPASRPAPSGG